MPTTRVRGGGDTGLAERQKALTERAERDGVDWKTSLANVPDDERFRVAALATLLGLDAHLALNPEIGLEELGELAIRARVMRELAGTDESGPGERTTPGA